MGIKYIRKYDDIISDMVKAVSDIDNLYEFLEMETNDWNKMTDGEKHDCTKTICDDIFYALGSDPAVCIGNGKISYVKGKSVLEVYKNTTLVGSISLV